MAGPDRRFVTFAVVAIGVIAAGVGLALAHRRGNQRRKQSTRQPAGESTELQERAHSPIYVENEVHDDNVSSATGGNLILSDEGNSRFLTADGVKEDLQEDGRATEGGFGTVIFLVSQSKPENKFVGEGHSCRASANATRGDVLREACHLIVGRVLLLC